jgi:hypothetical protein
MEMNSSSESLWTEENASAAAYREDSWLAYELETEPPDPATLSDQDLYAFLHFEDLDLLLPTSALEAVEAESLRRGASAPVIDNFTALAMVVVLCVGGVLIGFGLLVA